MSQNPNDGPNYSPYGQNPPNPNYPPGTAYGGSPQPPSGPNPNYNPYPPANPPSGPNPNVPNSSYAPYGTPNPYAPPPPPGPVQGMGQNPYDPYAPTTLSQNPISNPGYPNQVSSPGYPNQASNPGYPSQVSSPGYPSQVSSPGYPAYNSQGGMMNTQTPPPMSAPQPQPRGRGMTVLISVIALIVIVGGIVFGAVAYNNNQQTLHANATSTAVAQANASVTAVAAQATTIAKTYPFSNKQVLADPLVDTSKGYGWDNDGKFCFFSGSAYHVADDQANTYSTCAAIQTDFTNFTFEAAMVIKGGGDGTQGGLIFRADENNNKFYRLAIDTTGSYFVLVSVDSTGTGGNARQLKQGTASSFNTGFGATNILSIVARGDNYSFYVNQQLVGTFTDSTYAHGQIGFDVGYGTSKPDVVFTNAKVWQLPANS